MAATSTDQMLVRVLAEVEKLADLPAQVANIEKGVCKLEEQLKSLNGTVREHDKEVAILKDWRTSQVTPAVIQVRDLKTEVAVLAAKYAGLGGMVALVLLVAKQLGFF